MAIPADLQNSGTPDPSVVLFDDGLGVRRLERDDISGDLVEKLVVSLMLSKHAAALRERATRLANFRHPRFPRVRGVEVSDDLKVVAVVSDPVEGVRLSDLIAQSEQGRIGIDVHAAIQVGREVLPALATLHGSRDVTHGTLAAERLVLTKLGRVMVMDHALGAAMAKLQYPRPRLWKDYRIAMPPAAGLPRFDQRADIAQVAMVMLQLILGRGLALGEFPDGLKALVGSVTERLGSHAHRPMSASLRAWFEQALPVDARKPLSTALDAQIALEEAVKRERAYAPDPSALRHLAARAFELVPVQFPVIETQAPATPPLRIVSPASGAPGAPPTATPAPARRRSAPRKPAPPPTAEDDEADEIAFLERELARLADEERQKVAAAAPPAPVSVMPPEAPPVPLADPASDPIAFGGPLGEAVVEVISETPRSTAGDVVAVAFIGADPYTDAAAAPASTVDGVPAEEPPAWCLTAPEASDADRAVAIDEPVAVVDSDTLWLDFESMHVSRQMPDGVAATAAASGLASQSPRPTMAHLVAPAAALVSTAACTTLGAIADAARRYRGFAAEHAPFVRARDVAEPSAPWLLATQSVAAAEAAALAPPVPAAPRRRVTRLARALTVLPFARATRRKAKTPARLPADTLVVRAAQAVASPATAQIADLRVIDADATGRFERGLRILTSSAFRALSMPLEAEPEIVAADALVAPDVPAVIDTPAVGADDVTAVAAEPEIVAADALVVPDVPAVIDTPAAVADDVTAVAAEPEIVAADVLVAPDVPAVIDTPAVGADDVTAVAAEPEIVAAAMLVVPDVPAVIDTLAVVADDVTAVAAEPEIVAADVLVVPDVLAVVDAHVVVEESASAVVDGQRAQDAFIDTGSPALDESDPEIAALLRELEELEHAEDLEASRARELAPSGAVASDATPDVTASAMTLPQPALAVALPCTSRQEPTPVAPLEPDVVTAVPDVAQAVPMVSEAAPSPAPALAVCDELADQQAGEVPRKAKRSRGGARRKAKRQTPVSEPQPVVQVARPVAVPPPAPTRVVVHVEAPPVAASPASGAAVPLRAVPVPPSHGYAPWEVPTAAASAVPPASLADVSRSMPRSSFMDAPMPAVVVVPPTESAVPSAPSPASTSVPTFAPPPAVPSVLGLMFESPSFATAQHEVLTPAETVFADDDSEPVAPRTKVHRFPVRFDTRKINWKRTLAASLLLMLLEGAGFAAVYWFTQPSDLGYLNVRSTVDGLEVRIDGKSAGKTPLAVDLPAGRHTIEMSGFGLTKVLPVEIASGVQTTQMVKWPRGQKVGTLAVSSTPQGARVIIDGEMRGVTPVTLEGLTEGGHTLVLESDAGRVRQGVRVVANESSEVSVGIFAGWLNVFAPVQVRVFEDGKLLGTSEDGKMLLPPGVHRLELINPQLGLREQRTVEVTPGNTTTLSLDAPDGSVVIDAPEGTEVWIDGQQRGVAPMAPLNAAVGTREVILRHPQIGQRRFTVQVGVKAPARAEFFTP